MRSRFSSPAMVTSKRGMCGICWLRLFSETTNLSRADLGGPSVLITRVVDPERLELPTPAFEAQCSIQLSYGSQSADWLVSANIVVQRPDLRPHRGGRGRPSDSRRAS